MVFQRGLALVYLIAFINAVNQFKPLLGEQGLLPVPAWVRAVPFPASPSLFYLAPKDWAFTAGAWLGIALSSLALVGIAERLSTFSSREPQGGAADGDRRPAALAVFPRDVRRRVDQAARRSMLARYDLPGLSLSDPADAEPAELVLPLGA
jgi:hypothetical protein